ncbi:hypothetical protein KIPB_015284, partial [Kipferlia bialata]
GPMAEFVEGVPASYDFKEVTGDLSGQPVHSVRVGVPYERMAETDDQDKHQERRR